MKNEKNYVGFLIQEIWQILKRFSRPLSWAQTSSFWRVHYDQGNFPDLGRSRIFFSSWGMKELMPSTHYPWSDSTYLFISWLYDHLNVKFVKIECNIWKGACWRISLIWLKLFRFLCVFPDSVEKVYWYQHLTSILASTILLQFWSNCRNGGGQNGGQMLISSIFLNWIWKSIYKCK